jgi:hypothetical protein
MNPRVRAWVSDRIARRRREPPPPDAAAVAGAEELRDIGQVKLGHLLTVDQCAELRDYFAGKQVVDLYRPDHPPFAPLGQGRHPHGHVANHLDEDILAAPYLLELANRPQILDLLHHYFGCRPQISHLSAWWSYPTGAGPQQAENFHRDVDDWRFIKLFVYLTDVGAESGPHVYVRSSAEVKRANRIRRYSDDEIFEAFGRQPIGTQISGAGTGFLENTFGLHKGLPVETGHRLIFQAVYSLNPLPHSPRAPLAPFDRYLEGDEGLRKVNGLYLS